jgi:hypothetical protein
MAVKLRRVIIAARFRGPCSAGHPARNPGRPRSLGRRWHLINKNCETRAKPVGAENVVTARDLQVLVQEAAESILSEHADGQPGTWWDAACECALMIARGLVQRSTATSSRSVSISTSLAVSERASSASQPSTRTSIGYASRRATASDHAGASLGW